MTSTERKRIDRDSGTRPLCYKAFSIYYNISAGLCSTSIDGLLDGRRDKPIELYLT